MSNKIIIPADIPAQVESIFTENYHAITHNTDRLFLFSCDQKIEHLNSDFYGQNIHYDAQFPEHLFKIAAQGRIGAMATHLGLMTRYAKHYPQVNYIVKLNATTNLIPTIKKDPISTALWHIEHVMHFKQLTGLNIRGIGYTIYLGSEYESAMLSQAAQTIYAAHQHGLIAMLWIYPRGQHIAQGDPAQLAAGATGVANSLGADFVKIKPVDPENLKIAVAAAGNTRVICAGGKQKDPTSYLQELYEQIHTGGTAGCAVGRNIFQHGLPQALAITEAISEIVYDNKTVAEATKQLKK